MITKDIELIVERNNILEEENKKLYQKINELMSENAILKSSRSKFQSECQTFYESQINNKLTPSKDLNQKIYQQSSEIEKLKNFLQIEQNEKKEIENIINNLFIIIEKFENFLFSLKIIKKKLLISKPNNFKSIISQLNEYFSIIQFEISENIKNIKQNSSQISKFTEKITDLETQIVILKTENQTNKETNERFEKEREELTNAVNTLRKALSSVKEKLIESDNENRKLKEKINLKNQESDLLYSIQSDSN